MSNRLCVLLAVVLMTVATTACASKGTLATTPAPGGDMAPRGGTASRSVPDAGLTFYVLESKYGGVTGQDEIAEFHSSSTGDVAPFRKLKSVCAISVESLAIGPDGEIYIEMCSASAGYARLEVWAADAHGNQVPIRSFDDSIGGPGPEQGIRLDAADELFGIPKANSDSYAVWAPNAGGSDTPIRQVLVGSPIDVAMDASGNTWVLTEANGRAAVLLEFAPDANGNPAPIRTAITSLTSTSKIAVDDHGRPWIDYDPGGGRCAARFNKKANGNVTPEVTICPANSPTQGSENSFDVHGGLLYMAGATLVCPVHCSYQYWIATYKQDGTFVRDIYTTDSGPGLSKWNLNGIIDLAVH